MLTFNTKTKMFLLSFLGVFFFFIAMSAQAEAEDTRHFTYIIENKTGEPLKIEKTYSTSDVVILTQGNTIEIGQTLSYKLKGTMWGAKIKNEAGVVLGDLSLSKVTVGALPYPVYLRFSVEHGNIQGRCGEWNNTTCKLTILGPSQSPKSN